MLPRRWIVERTFAWIMKNRRVARDYEQLTAVAETLIIIAACATQTRSKTINRVADSLGDTVTHVEVVSDTSDRFPLQAGLSPLRLARTVRICIVGVWLDAERRRCRLPIVKTVSIVVSIGIGASHDPVTLIRIEEWRVGRAAAVTWIGVMAIAVTEAKAKILSSQWCINDVGKNYRQ